MSLKYKAYPAYKDSGIECLGKLPAHWVVQSLSIATDRISVGLATSVTDYYRDEGVPIIRNMNIKEGFFDGSDMLYLDEDFALANSGKVVYSGDVIAVHTGSNLGLACMVPEEFDNCHTFTTLIVTTGKELLNRYLTYCINSAYGKAEVHRLKFGFGKDNLNVKEFKCFYTLLPKYVEQQSIANFLDHETAKIDTLIAKQQQLIALLKEKRQAVISHAVTKGLNPNAPMRDSGVEWLGEVPAHWDVVPIKYIVSIPVTDGPHETPEFIDEGVPFISAEAVSTGKINFEKIRAHISEEDNKRYSLKYTPKKYDIYMVKSGATTGVTAIVETDDKFNIWSPLAVIRCKEDSYPYFVLNFMRSLNFQEAVELNWSFGTQQNIGMGVIENLHVTRPPLEEAKLIAKMLAEKCGVFDLIIGKALNQIELMQERRTALISAAVTGKIDVRDWQAPEPSGDGHKTK